MIFFFISVAVQRVILAVHRVIFGSTGSYLTVNTVIYAVHGIIFVVHRVILVVHHSL